MGTNTERITTDFDGDGHVVRVRTPPNYASLFSAAIVKWCRGDLYDKITTTKKNQFYSTDDAARDTSQKHWLAPRWIQTEMERWNYANWAYYLPGRMATVKRASRCLSIYACALSICEDIEMIRHFAESTEPASHDTCTRNNDANQDT